MITVYTATYNEELLIQFMIDHYRERFPRCHFVVNDNLSTDNTVKIARANGCEVILTDTDGQHRERHLQMIKNNSWKNAESDWVLVCDLDELLDISARELKVEEKSGTTIIKTKGYDMIAMNDKFDIEGMKHGVRDEGEDKRVLFNKKFIKEINFGIGSHFCKPKGIVRYSKKAYKLYNYCYPNYNVTVERYKLYAERKRKSPEDMKNGWTGNFETPEEIRLIYQEARKRAIKVR